MSLIKLFVSKHINAAVAAPPNGMEAIALFFYGSAPSLEEITALAVGAEVALSTEESKTRISITWPGVNTVITIDSSWDKTTQMQGLRGWAERFPAKVRALPEVAALIESFETVAACYGTVSRPGLDADNKVVNLLKTMLGNDGGFFFSRNSFYGTDGLRITGYSEDPTWLGVPQQETSA